MSRCVGRRTRVRVMVRGRPQHPMIPPPKHAYHSQSGRIGKYLGTLTQQHSAGPEQVNRRSARLVFACPRAGCRREVGSGLSSAHPAPVAASHGAGRSEGAGSPLLVPRPQWPISAGVVRSVTGAPPSRSQAAASKRAVRFAPPAARHGSRCPALVVQ